MALAVSITVFIAVVSAIVLFGYRRYVPAGRVYQNLENPANIVTPVERPETADSRAISRVAEFVAAKLPPSAETASALRLKLLAAGYRERNAVAILYGLKLMIMAGMALLALLLALSLPIAPLLRRVLPDALDLVVVCAEAGPHHRSLLPERIAAIGHRASRTVRGAHPLYG